jgi:hypothetical protein
MKKQSKKILFSVSVFFLLIFPLFITLIPVNKASANLNVSNLSFDDIYASDVPDVSPLDTIQVSTSDLIKNFQFYKFGDDYINPATNMLYDGRLIFEIGAWQATRNDLDLIYKYTIGNRTYLYWNWKVSSDANIYTNVKLADATAKDLSVVSDHILAGTYNHYNRLGFYKSGWKSYLDFDHYDFGDVIEHNSQNEYSGSLTMQFDINSGILPSTLTDGDEELSKVFDYIGISSVVVSDVEVGNLSSSDPNIGSLTPREYTSVNRTNLEGGDAKSSMNGLSNNYDPHITLSVETTPSIIYQESIQHTAEGASLNPLDKNGDALWNADQEESVKNVSFSFNVGSLTPRVEKYQATLSFYQQKIITREYLASIIPWTVKSRIVSSSDIAQTYTEDVALSVTNRYIRPTFEIIFSMWTAYEIESYQSTNHTLNRPSEDNEDMMWQALVSGYGGASTFTQFWESDWVSDWLFIQTYLKALEEGTITGTGSTSGPAGKIGKWWKDLNIWGKIGVGIVIVVGIFVAIGVVHAIRVSNLNIKRKQQEDALSL